MNPVIAQYSLGSKIALVIIIIIIFFCFLSKSYFH